MLGPAWMWLTDAWLRPSHLELSSRFRSSEHGEQEPGFRRAVDGGTRGTQERRIRRDVHDDPTPSLHHARECVLRTKEGALQVDVHHPVVFRLREGLEFLLNPDARVVDEDIDRAEPSFRFPGEPPCVCRLRYITANRQHIAERSQAPGRRPETRKVPGRYRHLRAFAEEGFCGR